MKLSRSRTSRRKARGSRTDIAILISGVLVAAAAGVFAYRVVGPYGDGPLTVGLYRAQDPDTGATLIYRDVSRGDGTVLRYFFDDTTRTLKQIQVRRAVDGSVSIVGLHIGADGINRLDVGEHTVERDANGTGTKVGFSLRGDSTIDAWEYRDAAGMLTKIELSRRRDGAVDRWEYYEDDQLARVEEDENRDGRVDRWLTFEAGILINEARDKNGDGQSDPGT